MLKQKGKSLRYPLHLFSLIINPGSSVFSLKYKIFICYISDDLVIIFVKAGMMRYVTTFILMKKLVIRGDKLMKMDPMDTLMIFLSDQTKISKENYFIQLIIL